MSGELRVCLVGTGRAGLVHGRNLRWRVPGAQLTALVEVDPGRLEQAAAELELPPGAAFPSLEEALRGASFEAVVITTPTFTHAELAVLAAQAGRHVLCEKPMALSTEECDRMIAAGEQAGVALQIGFMRRFDPAFRTAKEEIEAGRIGSPLVLRSLTRGPGLPPAWACDPERSNGMLAEVNSHDFDTVRWLSGSEFAEIFAAAAALKVPELRRQYPGFYDTALVSARLESGALATIDGLCPADYGYDARAEVVGTQGMLTVGELRSAAVTRVTREGGVGERQFASWRERFGKAYREEAAHFVDCALHGRPPEVGGQDGRAAVAAVLAANQSIRLGRPIRA